MSTKPGTLLMGTTRFSFFGGASEGSFVFSTGSPSLGSFIVSSVDWPIDY